MLPKCSNCGQMPDEPLAALCQDCVGANVVITPPAYYMRGGIFVMDAIEAWGLGFHLGNVVKYVARAGHKEDALKDLKKAMWYLKREIELRKGPTP